MPVEGFTDGLEPEDHNAVIWRFMSLSKFQDLLKTSELYFCRADRFSDETEGLPPEEYEPVLRLNCYDLNDIQELNNHIGAIAQFRESFYINCWHLFEEETASMWNDYGQDGVAISTRYSRFKSALDSLPGRPHLGLVRYGAKHLTGWNTIRFITTKREEYAHEKEVRALLWITDKLAGGNRHIDEHNRFQRKPLTPPPPRVPRGVRRRIDVQQLLAEIIVTPRASSTLLSEVRQAVEDAGCTIAIRPSELTRYQHLLP